MTATFPPLRRVGWTSTRAGLTPTQKMVARITLVDLRTRRGAVELHHGWCLGGDDEGAAMAQLLGYRIVAHPGHPKGRPNDLSMRGQFTGNDGIREPGEFLARDRDIVNDTDVTLAFLPSETYPGYGGTWYTARYAIKLNKPRLIITPSGRVYDSHGVEQIWTPVDGEESA